MASTSGHGLELNRRDRGFEAETSDGHEKTEDVFADNMDSHMDGDDQMVQLSGEVAPGSLEPLEPYIGMEFKSLEAVREFYELYGMRTGFTIRNGHIRRSHKDNSIIGREFVCSKEGFRAKKYLNMERRTLPPRPITREGCNATLRVSKKEEGKWVVSGFVKDHSHILNPSRIPRPQVQRHAYIEDEKDKKIKELFDELQQEKRLHAACQRRLNLILKDIEEHTQNLSLKVELIVNNVRELESEDQEGSHDIQR
ncbi:hypothetical protein Syun_005885 [Stephania yunnanensis]|uniref:FAR1 domain-containing protein n=1 Tax=Stephania yunnanensis TaxID=152371 RepID=A0AAP0KX94_9MAGN